MGDNTQPDAWSLGGLGYAIGALVDRELNRPPAVLSAQQTYGTDANGNLYVIGQPAGRVSASVATGGGQVSPVMLLLILGGLYLASK